MREWLNRAVSKTVEVVRLPGVRIPPSPRMYYVYILKSLRDGRYYYGSTSELESRLKAHNSGKVRSTKSRRPLIIHYREEYRAKSEARKRELFFKSRAGHAWLKGNGII